MFRVRKFYALARKKNYLAANESLWCMRKSQVCAAHTTLAALSVSDLFTKETLTRVFLATIMAFVERAENLAGTLFAEILGVYADVLMAFVIT